MIAQRNKAELVEDAEKLKKRNFLKQFKDN